MFNLTNQSQYMPFHMGSYQIKMSKGEIGRSGKKIRNPIRGFNTYIIKLFACLGAFPLQLSHIFYIIPNKILLLVILWIS